MFFYDRPKISAGLWLIILAIGIASYTTLLKREGFPTITVPYSLVSGTYLVNDASKVDSQIGKPLAKVLAEYPGVKMTDVQSSANFYTAAIQYEESVDAPKASVEIKDKILQAGFLPADATIESKPLSVGVNERGDDMLVAFYSKSGSVSLEDLTAKAKAAAEFLNNDEALILGGRIEAIDPFARGIDPSTGLSSTFQRTFDRFGIRENQVTDFHTSVNIGIKGTAGFDVLQLDDQVNQAVQNLNKSAEFSDFQARISYSLAPDIKEQVSSLQKSLAEGLIAILIISAILIALRASLITVGAMVMVIMSTLGLLLAIGYSLNTITLFALILSLSLIVDDTIIMVEAIDAQRRKNKNARKTIEQAAKKISRVMVAATFTAGLAFVPLIFVGGILGSFIRAIPITVISALIVSLVVALTFIPFLARFALLRPKQLGRGESGKSESAAHHLERFIAGTLARPLMWSNHHRKRQVGLGMIALTIGIGFIVAGGMLFSKVGFNIFAPSKDANLISVIMTFNPNQTIEQTQVIADKANEVVGRELGANFKTLSFYDTGTTQMANATISLVAFDKRDEKAPAISDQLEKVLTEEVDGALFQAGILDVGPPVSEFTVRIDTDNSVAAAKVAKDVSLFLATAELKRPDGTVAKMGKVVISNPDSIARRDGNLYISVSAEFDGDDTSTLVILAESAVKKEFPKDRLAGYGLTPDSLNFDIGQEGENQDSFKTLLIAFPIVLVAIYLLLATQFKSLLQPVLIFSALPFSLFGITMGLWITDNAFSFFTMLGFFALIGLSIKNTILLTDFANQARKSGATAVEAVATSLQERFRPLLATSLTAIVSLIPLYLSAPFWEGLTVTLMFGLLSSTFLVVTVFPYYYLGAEYLRLKVRRRIFALWLLLVALQSFLFVKIDILWLIPVGVVLTSFCLPYVIRSMKKGSNRRNINI